MLRALALRHTSYVGPDLVGEWLRERGFALTIGDGQTMNADEVQAADMLLILGGEMGVYERNKHPWLTPEIAAIRARLNAGKPTLGLCLGAQLMAAALGAEVRKGAQGQEIGWRHITLTPEGRAGSLAPLDGARVMQWHGDTFDIPPGATRLAGNDTYMNQAFAAGDHALALQFHLETTPAGLEGWLDDHDHPELAELGLSEARLRADAADAFPPLRPKALAVLDAWWARTRGA
jgi:GMP synthase (glutamine-hydrolysing)